MGNSFLSHLGRSIVRNPANLVALAIAVVGMIWLTSSLSTTFTGLLSVLEKAAK